MGSFGIDYEKFRQAFLWQTFLWQTLLGNKYKPNKKDYEFVGIKSARLIWLTDSGIDNSTDDAGNSGLTVNTFDTTTEADSAQIKLENTGGSTETIRGAAIRGKPVIRLSGKSGWRHDELVDYEDIYKNGEKKFEIGNNYIVTKAQVEKLADFHWKNFRDKHHIYAMTMKGTRYWFSPGQWYTLTFNYGGEYIDSICECYSCQTERGTKDVGTTVVSFREVYENWSKDSNSIARFIAGGNPINVPDYGRIIVSSADHIYGADYYCDGSSDEYQINKAISEIAGMGGGVVELTEGTYYIDGGIILDDNIAIIGKGWKTTIDKNCNAHGISATGISGTEKNNIILRDFKIQRNTSDENLQDLINFTWTNNSIIDHVYVYRCDHYGSGIELINVNKIHVINCLAEDNGRGIYVNQSGGNKASYMNIYGNNVVDNDSGITLYDMEYSNIQANICNGNNDAWGILLDTVTYSDINSNVCKDNGDGGNHDGGTILNGNCDHNIIVGNNCEGNNKYGIAIDPEVADNGTSDRNVIMSNRATGNTVANFLDNGSNTLFETAANDPYNEFA